MSFISHVSILEKEFKGLRLNLKQSNMSKLSENLIHYIYCGAIEILMQ